MYSFTHLAPRDLIQSRYHLIGGETTYGERADKVPPFRVMEERGCLETGLSCKLRDPRWKDLVSLFLKHLVQCLTHTVHNACDMLSHGCRSLHQHCHSPWGQYCGYPVQRLQEFFSSTIIPWGHHGGWQFTVDR